MWIGVGLVGVAGMRAGRVEAISQEEFLGYLVRKGCLQEGCFVSLGTFSLSLSMGK